MRHIPVVLAIVTPFVIFGQDRARDLAITNYLVVDEQVYSPTQSKVTYRADIVNTGQTLMDSVAASLTSVPLNVQVMPGQHTLRFAPALANTQVSSSNTFTILVDRSVPFDVTSLRWAFHAPAVLRPIANPGPNQKAQLGQPVTLNGVKSSNPSGDGTLTYRWRFASRPPGSKAELNNAASVRPAFVPDVAGEYVIVLTVDNGVADASARMRVSTTQPPSPIADPGPERTVAVHSTVLLDGAKSASARTLDS